MFVTRWIPKGIKFGYIRKLSDLAPKSASTFEDAINDESVIDNGESIKYREASNIILKDYLERWINSQETFPKGTENDFKLFHRFSSNPSRYYIPEMPEYLEDKKFKEVTEKDRKDIINHFRSLVRYSYPRSEKKVFQQMKPIIKKFGSYPEIKDELLYYHIKKGNIANVKELCRTKGNYYYYKPSTYLSFLDTIRIYKNSKESLAELRKITKHLIDYNIPISNHLIYKLYYTLPLEPRKYLYHRLNEVMDIESVLFDKAYHSIPTFDIIKDKLIHKEIKFSYGSYIQLNKLMMKEMRIEEGFRLINYLISNQRVEISPFLVKYTIDLILAHEPHLAIPLTLYLQRLTGSSLKVYTINRLSKMIVSTRAVSKDTINLMNCLHDVGSWQKKPIWDQFISNFDQLDSNTKEELLSYCDPLTRTSEEREYYENLNTLFTTTYTTNDLAYKFGYDIEKFDEIFKLFLTFKKFNILRDEILTKYSKCESESDFIDIWNSTIEPFAKKDKPLFMKLCRLIIKDIFLVHGQYYKIISFVNYIKEAYGYNIEYFAYLKIFFKISANQEYFEMNEISESQLRDMLKSTDLQLAILIANHYKFKDTEFIKSFIERNPIIFKLLEVANNSKNNTLFAENFKNVIEEIKWDPSLPPQF